MGFVGVLGFHDAYCWCSRWNTGSSVRVELFKVVLWWFGFSLRSFVQVVSGLGFESSPTNLHDFFRDPKLIYLDSVADLSGFRCLERTERHNLQRGTSTRRVKTL